MDATKSSRDDAKSCCSCAPNRVCKRRTHVLFNLKSLLVGLHTGGIENRMVSRALLKGIQNIGVDSRSPCVQPGRFELTSNAY